MTEMSPDEVPTGLDPAKGGRARAEKLTPEERQEIARRAAAARWHSGTPRATHEGELEIGSITVPCAVLEDGTRVISQRGMSKALGRVITGSGTSGSPEKPPSGGVAKLPNFLSAKNLIPFIDNDLAASLTEPIRYIPLHGGRTAYGFKAELMPNICEVWLQARDAGVLTASQNRTADAANILVRGLAHVGILALVDEATGYQKDRARFALHEILERFIAKELLKWAKMFPDDFYQEMFRLRKWDYNQVSTKRPVQAGKLTADVVYERLAPGVLAELKKITPRDDKGRLKHKYHQRLTEDIGHPRLREHLAAVIALMRAFDSWPDFYRSLNRSLPKQMQLPLLDWAESGENAANENEVAEVPAGG